ncbi:MAG: CRISPR-associated endonuclease Cas1 [Saprospiraceae bacterium]
MARSIVAAGLIPSLGIHHKSKYNAFCLADDLIEPFRPIVDIEIVNIIRRYGVDEDLNSNIKRELLSILTLDVKFPKGISPLMIACNRVANSFVKCMGRDE